MSIRIFSGAARRNLTDLKIPDTVAFMDDLASSGRKAAPITSGLFRMGRGTPLPFTYEYDEYKFLLEGEMTITEDNGTVHELKAGDLIFFPSGAKVKFSSHSSGLAFYCAQR